MHDAEFVRNLQLATLRAPRNKKHSRDTSRRRLRSRVQRTKNRSSDRRAGTRRGRDEQFGDDRVRDHTGVPNETNEALTEESARQARNRTASRAGWLPVEIQDFVGADATSALRLIRRR